MATTRKKKAPAKRESGKDPHPRYLADKRRYKYNGQPRLVYRLVTSEPVEFELPGYRHRDGGGARRRGSAGPAP
jgi:hypothetical protein